MRSIRAAIHAFRLTGLCGIALLLLAGVAAADATVTNLRCEYLKDPLGIDIAKPRLSWQLVSSERELKQTAYQIVVEGLWDSGKVASDHSVNVEYGGPAMKPGQRVTWKVRVWPGGVWSKSSSWTTGPEQWTAKWIGTGESFKATKGGENTLVDPWFRKTFKLKAKPKNATAFVASIGFHELYVNGQKIGDAVLMPDVTDNSKRARYVTYDIAEHLQPGDNVIGLWLGTSWAIFPKFETADKPRAPLVIGQFDLDDRRIVTDESWRTHPSPSMLLGEWNYNNFGGELYDASKDLPDWATAALDDSGWQPAKVFTPSVVISADKVEPNRLLTELKPVAITEPEPGVYRVDMGRNFAGFTEIAVRGRPGDRIDFLFSEQADKPITHRLRSAYIIGPTGEGTFRNRFNYSSARWITITGLQQKPDLRGWLVRNDYERAAAFASSSQLLNDIYSTTLWTFENLAIGGYVVDCPQRERMGYGGDAHATTTTGLSNYKLGAFYSKWSEDWRDVQGKDGNLPYTAPTYWGGGGPAWSGYFVHLPWEMYRWYGDKQILERNFQNIERWLAFLETKSKDNLLRRWGGKWDFLGDWLWPDALGVNGDTREGVFFNSWLNKRQHEAQRRLRRWAEEWEILDDWFWPSAEGFNGDTRETLFFNNCYWIYDLQTAAQIATVLGKSDHATAWNQRADDIRRAVHAKFFNAADNSYVNGFQAYLALALLTDVPPPESRSAVWKRLEREILMVRKGHIHAGITGGAFLFKALMESHRDDLLYAMVGKDDYPGWGYMLKQGATTFWEYWEGRPMSSRLHSSYLYVGAWFIQGILGIQPDPKAPGFKHFVIRPAPLDLSWAKGHYDSLYGRIESTWRHEAGRFMLEVTVPPNTTATVILPGRGGVTVDSGTHKFETKL
jgi:alpha-L-rhamnosidase